MDTKPLELLELYKQLTTFFVALVVVFYHSSRNVTKAQSPCQFMSTTTTSCPADSIPQLSSSSSPGLQELGMDKEAAGSFTDD